MATSSVKIVTKDQQTFEAEFTDNDDATIAVQLANKIKELEEGGHWVSNVQMRPLDNTQKTQYNTLLTI